MCRPAVLAAALRRLSSSTEWKRLLDAADRLPGTLTELPERLTRAADELVEVACRLARALTDISYGLSRALADISDRLAGPLANVTHRIASALADVADGLACALADILERPFCPLANVLCGITGLVDRLTRALADLGDRPTQPLHQLGISIEARHQAVDNRGDVVEPGLQHRLRLHAFYVELYAAEVNVDAHVELDQVQHVRLHGEMGVEVVELEMDQVHPQLRHVQQDVRRSAQIAFLAALVAPVLAVADVFAAAGALSRARTVPALLTA